MGKKVQVVVSGSHKTDVSSFVPFQGKMKTLSPGNYEKLKNEILETGFAFAVHVWDMDGKLFLIDGHQRVSTLLKMQKEGVSIPDIPYVVVKAKTYSDAKRHVLQGVSQYGSIQKDGFKDFVDGLDFTLDDKFDLPDFSFDLDSPDVELDEWDTDLADTVDDVEENLDGIVSVIKIKCKQEHKDDVVRLIRTTLENKGFGGVEII